MEELKEQIEQNKSKMNHCEKLILAYEHALSTHSKDKFEKEVFTTRLSELKSEHANLQKANDDLIEKINNSINYLEPREITFKRPEVSEIIQQGGQIIEAFRGKFTAHFLMRMPKDNKFLYDEVNWEYIILKADRVERDVWVSTYRNGHPRTVKTKFAEQHYKDEGHARRAHKKQMQREKV